MIIHWKANTIDPKVLQRRSILSHSIIRPPLKNCLFAIIWFLVLTLNMLVGKNYFKVLQKKNKKIVISSWIKMLNKFISGVIFLELVGGTQNILKMAYNLFLKNFSLWKSMINFKRFDELILSGKKTMKMIWLTCFLFVCFFFTVQNDWILLW